MRHLIVASHAHFSQGLLESLELVLGAREGVRVLTAFVDSHDDISQEVDRALADIPVEDEAIVCTDVLGGSVNNEFLKRLGTRPGLHIVTNMNLPLLLQLSFAEEVDLANLIRSIVSSSEVRPVYCNDAFAGADGDDEF